MSDKASEDRRRLRWLQGQQKFFEGLHVIGGLGIILAIVFGGRWAVAAALIFTVSARVEYVHARAQIVGMGVAALIEDRQALGPKRRVRL